MVELTAQSSRSGRAIATFLNFYASHGSTARLLRGSEKYLICRWFIAVSNSQSIFEIFSKTVNS